MSSNGIGSAEIRREDEKESKQMKNSIPHFCSQRWILAYLSFFGFAFAYAMRLNLSVAMICMVKTEVTSHGILTNESYNNNTDLRSCMIEGKDPSLSQNAEFNWDKTLTSSILAAFFFGYLVTQIPSGWLSDKFGGRRVFGIGMLISAISTIVLPVCARQSYIYVYILRVISGLALGVCFPAIISMWGRWAPPMERTKLTSFIHLGAVFGSFGIFSSGGLLCEYGFDHGWGSIFIITGGLTVIWVLVWFFITTDSPSIHPLISDVEKNYILSSIEYNTDKRTVLIPWKSIATSKPFLACLTAHFCYNWTLYTLMTSLPTFMKEALHMDIKQNGILSSLPFLTQAAAAFITGQTADVLRSKQVLSFTGIRKLFQLSSFVGAGALLAACGFLTCQQRYLTVAFICIATFFMGLSVGGFLCNHVDIAPKYAGVVFGITNTTATLAGMLAPIIAGALTPNQSAEEWRNVFYVCAGLDLLGIIVFGCFASGDVQPWATDGTVEFEVVLDGNQSEKSDKQQNVKETVILNGVENKGFEKTDTSGQ